jgi:hypothetical protein
VKLLRLLNHSYKHCYFRPSRRSLAAAPHFFRQTAATPSTSAAQPARSSSPSWPCAWPIWARPPSLARVRGRHAAAAGLGERAQPQPPLPI